MLQFILGKSASGKTYTVMNKIKELAYNNSSVLLIVPEQFTFESERNVLKALGDSAALNVNVLSFSRICDEVGNLCGGISGKILGDADKIIFMHRALNAVKAELKLWGRYADNLSFSGAMLDTIGEFKINAVIPGDIKKAAEKVSSATLSAKLYDIALIYETYDMLVAEKFIDPADRLTKLYYNLENVDFFKEKTVFLDSFKGFTGQQFKIIERIFSQAENIYICLTDNTDVTKEYSVFTNIRSAAEKIKLLAKNHHIEIAEPIILGESKYNSVALDRLEQLLSSGKAEIAQTESDDLNICRCGTIFDEAEFTARTIRRLVRTEGYRYRDFVIIARDSVVYEEAIVSAAVRNKISIFYDKRIPLSSLPMSVAVALAIEALNFSTENILRFHKTGLGTLKLEEISLLENYTYLWNIDGNLWLDYWDMDTRGFVSSNEEDELSSKTLQQINELREKTIAPIVKFKDRFYGNAENMARAIAELFENCSVPEKLRDMCESITENELPFSEDVLKQGFDEYIGILDSLVNSFGNITLDKEQFSDALAVAVDKATIGVIPQCLDQVTFGSADRIRPSRPKIAFILGANQGVFPQISGNSGLFNIIERKNLIDFGLNIADNSVYSSIDEEYLVYCNLCCPSEKLYICYHERSLSGEKTEPSAFVDSIIQKLECKVTCEPLEELSNLNMPETDAAAFTEFCRKASTYPSVAASVAKPIKERGQADRAELINSIINNSQKSISPDTAKALYKENIYMSATKLDTFNRCKFSFFCRYGLKAQKLQPADFDVLQRGTIVHFVLERFINTYKKGIADLESGEIERLTDEYIEEYLKGVSGFKSVRNARTEFLISRVSRSLKDVVMHMAEEFSQSDFEPVGCELKIGGDGIPLEFAFSGGKIRLNGSIDRVDEYNGYVRIIDYKTGSRAFKLPDILFGLNLQMLLYLYAVTRGRSIEDSKAAGILYMPSKRDTNDKGMAMNGLLAADCELIKAMDKEMAGEFVPKLALKNDGTISKANKSFISSEQFGEIFDYIEKLMVKTGESILSGDIAVAPIDGRESKACAYCDFSHICGIEEKEAQRVPELNNEAVFAAMKGGEANAD